MKCKYQTEEMSGLDCPCEKCAKTRDFLHQKELDGEIYIGGLEEDKKKIRR